jgi:hypothetical protein
VPQQGQADQRPLVLGKGQRQFLVSAFGRGSLITLLLQFGQQQAHAQGLRFGFGPDQTPVHPLHLGFGGGCLATLQPDQREQLQGIDLAG